MARRRPKQQKRGFALLIVVLVVALIAVSSVALLDIVNVDLVIAGQHRRSVDAQAMAMGAMMEVVSDDTLLPVMPDLATNQLHYQYAGKNGAVYQRDPMGRFATTPMNETNSAFVRNIGTPIEQGYNADIRLLRVGNEQDTGITKAQAITYEVSIVADLNNGEATREVRSEIQRVVAIPNGLMLQNVHAR